MTRLITLSLLLAAPAFAHSKNDKTAAPADNGDELGALMKQAEEASEPSAAAEETPPPAAQPAPEKPKLATAATRAPSKPVIEQAPITDDNDTTAEAAPPAKLTAVRPAAKRTPGAYELGDLDCRMLDGAGIERILPKKIVAGEEPDLLCRVMVTQPATVAATAHKLTLTVAVGDTATYQQVRTVRVSSVGRRSMIFVVPADRISSEDAARVTMRAQLVGGGKTQAKTARFVVEPAD